MNFSIQPVLENEKAILAPLTEADFDTVYAVASDKNVWAHHPNKDRWKEEVFRVYFDGGIQSKGAFRIIDKATGETAGSTRFYDYDEKDNSILIGYTFYATKYWGTGFNPSIKKLMLDYIFQYVDKVYLHVGATNFRSQIAVGRLGAVKIMEKDVAYHGEPPKLNFIYEIPKAAWLAQPGNKG